MSLSPAYTLPEGFQPFNFEDILMGNDRLWSDVDQDKGGNNEAGRQARITLQALWPIIAQRLADMNMMTPQVQAAIQRVTQALSPEGTQTLADEQYSRLQQKGQESGEYRAGRLRSAGASTAAQEGARQAQMNVSTDAGNDYLNDLFSPSNIATRSGQLLDFQNNLAAPAIQQMLGVGQFVEGRHQQNQNEKMQGGMNGFIGALGQLAGMGGGQLWSSIFKPQASMVPGMSGSGGNMLMPGSSPGNDFNIFGSPRFG